MLGGKAEYASDPALSTPDFEPRLFQVSNATGALRVEEVFDFQQEDLIDEDVMLLDTFSSVYVWVGDLAHKEEKEEAPKIAAEYVNSAPDDRNDKDTPIVLVKAGNEPLLFTCHFVGWDSSKKKGIYLSLHRMGFQQEERYLWKGLEGRFLPNSTDSRPE